MAMDREGAMAVGVPGANAKADEANRQIMAERIWMMLFMVVLLANTFQNVMQCTYGGK